MFRIVGRPPEIGVAVGALAVALLLGVVAPRAGTAGTGTDAAVAVSHPDAPPPGIDLDRTPSTDELRRRAFGSGSTGRASIASTPTVECAGDGVLGNRVEVIYAHATDVPSRYAQVLPMLRQYSANADLAINASAGKTGDGRRVRFVHDASCVLTVRDVTLPATGDDSFAATNSALAAQGLDNADRKYLAFVEGSNATPKICGIAGSFLDDSAGAGNANNGAQAQYARVDAPCWGHADSVEAHEIVHNLGAVQDSAVNSNGAGHCVDDADRMCYDDGSGATVQVCPADQEWLLDCNNNDYFHTSPAAGSYLATHWNAANSSFLITVPKPAPVATALALSAPPPTTTAYATFGMIGTLTNPATTRAVTGAPVALWGRRAGAAPVRLAISTTSSGGKVTLTARPDANTTYYATYAGNATWASAQSAAVGVKVAPRMSIRISAVAGRPGPTVSLSGKVEPLRPGVRVTLQQQSGTSWRTLTSAALSARSEYLFRTRPTVRGTYRYRVLKAPDTLNLAGVSPTATMTLR